MTATDSQPFSVQLDANVLASSRAAQMSIQPDVDEHFSNLVQDATEASKLEHEASVFDQDEELMKLIEASSILNLVELTQTALEQGLIQPQPKYN